MIRSQQKFLEMTLHWLDHYFWDDPHNWHTTYDMTHNVGGFLNHLQQELNYKSLVVEVHKLKLPRTLYTEYSIADLKLLHSLNEDVTADNIGILIIIIY